MGRAPLFLGIPSLGIGRTLKRLARGLEGLEALKLIAIFFSNILVLSVTAGTRLLVLGGLYLLELRIENLTVFPLDDSSRV